jgi:hypothetical protein
MVNDLRDVMLNRETWSNTIREVSIAQKNKQSNNNTNTSIKSTTTVTAKRRGRPPGKRVVQRIKASPNKDAAKRRARIPDLYVWHYVYIVMLILILVFL